MKNSYNVFIVCFLIISSFAILHTGFAAGTLVKTACGYRPIENLQVGDFVYSITPHRTYNLTEITHITSYTLPTAIKIITENDVIITTSHQRLYLPHEQKWIAAKKISPSSHLGTGKSSCTTKFQIQDLSIITTFFDIRLNNFHTFCVSTDDIIVHNFPLFFIGFSVAWGTGKICLDTIYAGICIAGFWIGTKLLKNTNKNCINSNIKIQPCIATGGAPDPDDENWFEKLKQNYAKKGRSQRFGNIYKDPNTGYWCSRSNTNHAAPHYKVYVEKATGLEWIWDIDRLGNIMNKHKGPIGRFIPWKDIIFFTMNYINIESLHNFQELLDIDILITGDISRHKEELEYNTWMLCLNSEFSKFLTLKELYNCINKIIKKRSEQVIQAQNGPATFYLWYDAQSFNLGFDILSGTNIKLPFGCKLNILHNPMSILNNFLKDIQSDNNDLSWENIAIVNRGDPGWNDDDDGQEDRSNYILDVFVITLPQSNISKILQNIDF